MRLKTLIFLFCVLGLSKADNSGNCKIDGIEDGQWTVTFTPTTIANDNKADVTIFSGAFTGKLDDLSCKPNVDGKSNYVDFEAKDGNFIIKTAADIVKLDEETAQTTSPLDLNYVCSMTCDSGSSELRVAVKIADYNNHKPVFSQSSYKYTVSSPIMPNTDFTLNGDVIKASDLDFSNDGMTFTVDPPHFIITTTSDSTDSNKKTFVANIRAKSVVQLKDTTNTYTLTATDVGTNPGTLSQTASVIFTIDADNSLDIPSFVYQNSQTDYTFQYQSDNTLKPLSGPIKLNTQRSLTNDNFELVGDMKGKFSYKYDSSTKEITLSAEEIKDPTDTLTVLTLNINNGQVTVSTPIIIYFTMNSVKFNEHIYTGSYDDAKNQVNLDKKITVTSTGKSDVAVTISGDLAKYFKAVKDTDASTWSIEVTSPAPTVDELKKYEFLNLVLTATEDGETDTASLLVKLPSHVLQFSKILYEATYNNDNTVTMSDKIAFTTDVSSVDITVDTNYEKYFEISQKDKNYIIKSTTTPLPDDILLQQTEIAVIITAKDSYQNTQQAVVKMSLPEINTETAPKFSKSYYKSEYKQGQTDDYLDFTDPVTFENVDDITTVNIDIDAYSENFEIVYDKTQKKWRVHIKVPLTSKDFDSLTEILVIMKATETGVTKTGKSVLVIDLTTEVAPQFVDLYYSAEYKQSQTNYIDFKTDVAFAKHIDPKNLQITLDTYTDNFAVAYDAAQKKWRIQIKSPLDSKDFETLSEIVLIMEVSESGVTKTGKSVLVIELITEVGPQFSKLYYAAEYKQNQKDYIDFKEDVTFTEEIDPNNLKVTLDTYTDNFAVTYDTAQKKWRIQIKSPLNSEDFDSLAEIVLTMEATETGISKTGKSVLVIEIKKDETVTAPQFTDLYYEAEYKQSQTDYIDFKTDVAFTEKIDPKNLKIALSTYTDNFAVTYDTAQKKWRIQIKSPLDSKYFDTLSEIVLTMEATETGVTKTGKSVLVIELKTDATEVGPQFKDLYYQSEYKQGQTEYIDFKTDVAFEGDVAAEKLKITLNTYTDNFAVTYDTAEKKWRIKIKSPLSSKDFDTLSEIVLTMEATETGVTKTGKSVLVIELKTDATEVGPQFKDLYYQSEYKQGQTEYIDFKTDVAFEGDVAAEKLKITLNTYTDNFAVIYDTTQKKWRIQIKSPLSSKDFESLSEIVLTMEATESGVTKTGKSVLVIELKTDTTEVGPQFKDLYYQSEYKQGQTDYIEFKTAVAFEEDIDPKNIKISLDTYTDNFAVTYDTAQNKWRIQIKSPLNSKDFESLSEIVLTMEATESGVTKTGKSVLVIELKTDSTEVGPQFKDLYYQSEYKQGQTDYIEFKTAVAFEEDIDPKNIKISLDTYTDNFAVTYDTAQNKWRIQIKSPLNSKDFESLSEIVLTMEATESGVTKTGKSVLVIELKTDTTEVGPQFKDLYYQSEYKQGQTDYIEFKTAVAFEGDVAAEKLKITLNTYTDNFAVTYDTAQKKWRIQIKSPLSSKDFESLSEIVLTMEATETGVTKTGKSVLVIELKTDTTEVGPQFKDLYYQSEYKQDQTDYIEFKTDVAFEEDIDPKNIKISLDTYTDNFAVTYDTDQKKWRIQIKSPLDSKDFESLSEIVLTMEATESGVTKTGKSVLVIELKTDSTEVGPQFKDLYYQSEYKQGQTDYIEFTTALAFEEDIDPKNIKISLDTYTDNFAVTYDTAQKKWRIQIKSPLDSKDFESLSEIVLAMTATESGVTKTGKAVLVIELKTDATEVGPQFKELYYQSEYKQGQTNYIEFKTDVAFMESIDPKNLKVSLDTYTDNFAVIYDTTQKKWRIQIKSPLSSKDFESLSEIVLTMEATESGVTKTGKSVLVIELKTDTTEVGPQFKDLYYQSEYKQGQTDYIEFKTAVAFEEDIDPKNIKISLDTYTDNFAVTYDTAQNKWRIQIKSPLNSKDFESLSEIVLTMEATESGVTKTGKSVLVIELKTDSTEVGPQFKDLYYQSEYKQGQTDYIEFKTAVAFEEDIDPKNIKISLDTYTDNFAVTYDTAQNKWRIQIKSPLNSKDFESLSEIVLTMEATESGVTKTGKSVLVIELKTDTTEVGPQFKDLYYQSEYKQGQTDYIEFKTAVAFEEDIDPKNIKISLDTYTDNFAVTYDTAQNKWRIQIKSPLNSKDFESLSEIVLTMEATESGVTKTGKSVLVIELKTDTTEVGPQFKDLYYQSEYKQGQTDYIEFKTAVAFEEDIDPKNIKISLDTYTDNFAVTYDTAQNKWRIQIKSPLNSKDFESLSEIVLTMEATESGVTKTGKSVLVIELKTDTTEVGPQFKDLYYQSEYKQGQTDYIEFKTAVAFEEDIDPKNIKISLDTYTDNFAVTYDTAQKKWRIQIKSPLDSKDFETLSEIVLTMEVSESGVTKTGKSVLVIELKTDATEVGPQFKDLYYQSEYKQGQTNYIEFKTDVAFMESIDPKNLKVSLDTYTDNFAVIYDTTQKKWRIQIKSPLDSKDFESLSEIVLTMEATESGVTKTGKSVLVIELKTDATEVGPQFKDLYYQSEYKKDQTDYIEFKTAVAFEGDIDPKNIKITLDTYTDNFAVTYDTAQKKWRIQIKSPLDSKDFESLSEIVLAMTATESGVTKTGKAVLVVELKTDATEVGPQFKDLYYEADYKKDQTDYIDFNTDVAFTETIDPKNLKIAISDYTDNFAVEYSSDKWRIKITKPLEDSVFDTTTDLILVMEASETGKSSKGSSVLVIKLTGSSVDDKVPKFKDVYYTAEYPKEGKGTIPFDQTITFENVADINKVKISVSDYKDYFSVAYDKTKTAWFITIIKPLDLNVLTGSVVTTLSATVDGDDVHKPVAAFTLKLPELTAPIFTKPYYQAEYIVSGTTATVNLIDKIEFGANVDDSNIEITSDDYSKYFSFTFEDKQWKVITNGILDLKELDRSDLVVSITATDKTTKLSSASIIDLKLPHVNTEDAPKFVKTYYTASYTVSGDKATVTLDEQFTFSNRNDPKSVTLTTDKYQDNFKIEYTDGKWTITVDQNLDDATLNSNDIVMSLIATDSTTKDVGECTLLMTLPKINSKDAPKFDKAYYQSECDDATTSLDTEIAINNKDDLSKITVSILEDDYKSNFKISFDETAKVWKVAVVSVPKITTSTNDLILTLIATEKENTELGQATLVLNFPVVTAPKFSSIIYQGSYKAEEVSSFEISDVKITNKDKQDDIQLKLSLDGNTDISKYFKFTLTDNVWKITLIDPLPDDVINGKTELILTLSATEQDNAEIGYANVIISLEDNAVTSDLTFSDVYYSAQYIKSSPLPNIKLSKDISLKSNMDLKDAVVEFVVTDDFNANTYLELTSTETAGVYTISSKKELPEKILGENSLSLVLQASIDKLPKVYATLVIDLPIEGESNSIDFSKILYEATYTISSDDQRSFDLEDEITIETKEAASDLKVEISPDSIYGSYFSVKQDNYKVTITVDALIPSSIYEKISIIPLALEATSSGTQNVGKTVVNVNINYNKGSVKFSSSLYNGNYTVKEGEATAFTDTITLNTDQDADQILVEIVNDYKKYFDASYVQSEVKITKKADIPIADLKETATISIQLKATIKNSKVEDNTVINLLIITDDTPTPDQGKISFASIVNTGEYSVLNGIGEFKEDNDIKLTTDRQNGEIEVKFSDDSNFKDNFDISYKDQVVTVEKIKDLSNEDFQSHVYISLEMIATIKKSKQSSSAVLNIRMNNNGGSDSEHISFEYPAYKGLYNISNNMVDLDYDKITVSTDQTDENVEVKIAEPYNEYFDILYTNKLVQISLKDKAASNTLRSITNIPVVVSAHIKDTTHTATTVVNLEVRDYDNNNKPEESIHFPKLVNDAQYIMAQGEFSSTDMVVVTNVLDEYIECDLSNEYNYEKYFHCSYEHSRVQVTLTSTLPRDELKKTNNIALAVRVSDKNREGVYGDAILNIALKHTATEKEMNETGYIVAISILSVLMFILLAGTAGFYFYKFRKSRYEKMTEDEYMNSKVRFDKSSLKRPSNRESTNRSSAIEERRPTGFIFNNAIVEDEPRDSSTDPDMKERKKSVAFDENVEKLQIDSVNDDDIDKALDEVSSEEASAKV
ncbi:uncharacterized protein [Diabrotica undecimpunctata]|uniref:uncharacterized protein isoform X3 n=1 Tax=Diabrotica undecimpunctata TaxID=50387 RepID=UPI003B641787